MLQPIILFLSRFQARCRSDPSKYQWNLDTEEKDRCGEAMTMTGSQLRKPVNFKTSKARLSVLDP